jgi:hypothetical protein
LTAVCATIDAAIPELDGTFDLIVCADVLEHLVDPWTRDQLRDLAASHCPCEPMPNIRFAPAIARIALGRASSTRSRHLRQDHLRFFTRQDVDRLRATGLVPHGGGSLGHSVGFAFGEPSKWRAVERLAGGTTLVVARLRRRG